MSVSGLVLGALGLACGIGIAFYLATAGTDSPASADRSSKSDAANVEDEQISESEGAGSIDVEELMGVDETGGGAAEAEMVAGGSADEASGETGSAPREESPTHWFEGISGSIAGKTYLLEEPTSVGRLPRNDLQLNEGDVSRVHCRFRPEGESIVVEALDTPNGTRVNDTELSPGEPMELNDEDVVEIGKVLLMYHRSEADEMPDGLADESSEMALDLGADAATVTVDTTDWRDRVVDELEAAGGDISVAARALGMDPDALERLAERLENN